MLGLVLAKYRAMRQFRQSAAYLILLGLGMMACTTTPADPLDGGLDGAPDAPKDTSLHADVQRDDVHPDDDANVSDDVTRNDGGHDVDQDVDLGADAPPDVRLADVGNDAFPDRVSPDDADGGGGKPVWLSTSTAFDLRVWGGLPPPATDRDACARYDTTISFTAPNLLSSRGCSGDRQRANWDIELTSWGTSQLIAMLSTLRISSIRHCGADAPEMHLTVLPGGALYESTFYAGCPNHDRVAIDESQLQALIQHIALLRTSCVVPPDAGGSDGGATTQESCTGERCLPYFEAGPPPIRCIVLDDDATGPARDR
jgi:hypothetical protein